MDPMMIGAVLLAVVTGTSEALADRVWAGVISLVHRPLRGGAKAEGTDTATASGEAEASALQQTPRDEKTAVALARVLLARSTADPEFRHAFEDWWAQAEPIRDGISDVTNIISGGVQHGPVLQGRDFSNITFGARPSPPR
jgi:hypothetical protein